MIRWITENLGTASYYQFNQLLAPEIVLIDVRELTDKEGNANGALKAKIDLSLDALRAAKKVVVCCDMGISRSNAVAVGVLMALGQTYDEATHVLAQKADVSEINLPLLHQVRSLFQENNRDTAKAANLFITGAGGYVGQALRNRLGSESNIFCHRREELDLSHDTTLLDSYVNKRGIDSVIHLAHPHRRNNISALAETVAMTKTILEVCRVNSLSIVYLSSLAIYSGYGRDEILKANSQLQPWPRGAYGETKLVCEELIGLYQRNYGLKAIVLRPSSIYGPNMPRWTFFSKFFEAAMQGSTIRTHRYRNGLPVFDFLYISDLLDAFQLALRMKPEAPLHLGTGQATSTYELAKAISTISARGSMVETVDIDDRASKVVVDPSEARARLGWEAKVALERGLKELWHHHTDDEANKS